MKLQFPHISRLFSATTHVFLWGLLAGLVYINIFSLIQSHAPNKLSFDTLITSPFSSKNHLNMATHLWDLGIKTQAKEEIAIAQDLATVGNASVLGDSTSPESLLADWESMPGKYQKNYTYWKTLAEQIPGYRDAYLQAGIFAYGLGNYDEARAFVQKALELDPNLKVTSEFLALLQKI